MGLWKRGKHYWLDAVVHGERHREPLGTTDWREARDLEKKRLAELLHRPPDPTKRARTFAGLDVAAAVEHTRTIGEPKSHRAWWRGGRKWGVRSPGSSATSPSARSRLPTWPNTRIIDADLGRAPKTVNSELSVLRQLLKHAKLWYRFLEDYRPLKNTKPPVGQALTDDDQTRLFEVARVKAGLVLRLRGGDARLLLRTAGVRNQSAAVEARRLRRASAVGSTLEDAGRVADPSLNDACVQALGELHTRAARLGFAERDHFLFPWHGRTGNSIPPVR